MAALQDEHSPRKMSQGFLDNYDRAAALDPAGLEKLRKDEPFDYLMATNPIGAGLRGVIGYVGTDTFATLGPGGEYKVKYNDLDPAGQAAVRGFVSGFMALVMKVRPNSGENGGGPTFPDLDSLDWSNSELRIKGPEDMHMGPDIEGVSGGMIGVSLPAMAGGPSGFADFPLLDPHSAPARAIGSVFQKVIEGGGMTEENANEFESMFNSEYEAQVARKEGETGDPATPAGGGKTAAKERVIPETLKREIELTADDLASNQLRSQILRVIAEKAEIDVYADHFPGEMLQKQDTLVGKRTIWETLDKLGRICGSEWEYKDNAVLMRDRLWYEKRTWIIAQRWISKWEKALGTRQRYTFHEMCAMANELTDAQIMHSMYEGYKLATGGASAIANQTQWYRLYGMLTPQQQAQAEAKPGFAIAEMSPEQQQTFMAAASRYGLTQNDVADLRLTATEKAATPEQKQAGEMDSVDLAIARSTDDSTVCTITLSR